jgi:hypothetical protein
MNADNGGRGCKPISVKPRRHHKTSAHTTIHCQKPEKKKKIQKENLPQRLHHQMLNLIHRQPRLIRNHLKAHTPIIRMPFENCLNQRHETDLLSQEAKVFLQNRLQGKD